MEMMSKQIDKINITLFLKVVYKKGKDLFVYLHFTIVYEIYSFWLITLTKLSSKLTLGWSIIGRCCSNNIKPVIHSCFKNSIATKKLV